MKNLNTTLHVLALAAIAVLFFLVLKKDGQAGSNPVSAGAEGEKPTNTGAIAYFEMDSVEQHYDYIKDVRGQLKQREQEITAELEATKKSYMGRIQQLQAKSSTMSQQEGEAAQAEIYQMQQNMQQKEAKLGQELQEQQFKQLQEIQKKIEEFLKGYNQDKKFAYILSHQTGDFIYYKDSLNNITSDVVKGLNEWYKKK